MAVLYVDLNGFKGINDLMVRVGDAEFLAMFVGGHGAAAQAAGSSDPDALLKNADRAMYATKRRQELDILHVITATPPRAPNITWANTASGLWPRRFRRSVTMVLSGSPTSGSI